MRGRDTWMGAGHLTGKVAVAIVLALRAGTMALSSSLPEVPSPGYVLVNVIGGTGDAPGRFRNPTGIAVGPRSEIYIADSGNRRVQVLSLHGEWLRTWGAQGLGPGLFGNPVDIAVGKDGSVYVADFEQDRIQKFKADGTYLLGWGQSGTGEGEFDGAAGIATGSSDAIYVADFYNHRVQGFDSRGGFVGIIGKEGHGRGDLHYPTDLAVRADGAMIVADAYNDRIQAFKADGTPVGSDLGTGQEPELTVKVPTGVAFDAHGRVHVADSGHKRAVLLGAGGAFLAEWKLTGDEHPEIHSPTRVAVRGSLVYLVDTSNDRILVLTVR